MSQASGGEDWPVGGPLRKKLAHCGGQDIPIGDLWMEDWLWMSTGEKNDLFVVFWEGYWPV